MKNFKRTLTLLLVLALCVGCLAGCGGGKDKSKKKPIADSDDVTITVWSGEAGAQAVYEELVDEWNATTGDEKNIFINWEVSLDTNKVDVAHQSGQLPHIFAATTLQRNNIIKQGNAVALDDLPGGKGFVEDFGQIGIEGVTVENGKTYSLQTRVNTVGLAYNKDLFKQAGIVDENGEAKPPKTLKEVREYAKKISALGDGIHGFAFPLKFGLGFTVDYGLSSYYDASNLVPENSQKYTDLDNLTVDVSNYKEMYQWLLDMESDGSLFPDSLSLDNDMARAYFAAGTIGMIPAVSWDVGVYTTQFVAECDWDICQYPAPEGRELVSHWNKLGGMNLIGKKALENPEETMEVIKFIYSQKVRATLYERGINLSAKRDVLDVVDKTKLDPRFIKFAEFVVEDARYAESETYTVEGLKWSDLFQKVWMGEMTLDEAMKDYSARATAALRKAVERGEYDVERQKKVRRFLAGEDVDISKNK